jgi:hypothetical protein
VNSASGRLVQSHHRCTAGVRLIPDVLAALRELARVEDIPTDLLIVLLLNEVLDARLHAGMR